MAVKKFKGIRLRFLSLSVIFSLLVFVALRVLLYLNNKAIIVLPLSVSSKLNSITVVIITLFLTSLVLRLTIKRISNLFEELEEKLFYSKIYSWSLYSIGLFIILHHFGVSLGNITIFIGLITTGLAFAVRDVLLSFFGWMILLRKKPFRIGDYIRIGEEEGTVLHIGTFYVLLDSTPGLPGEYSRVPNRLFLEKSIIKLGKEDFFEQVKFNLTKIPPQINELIAKLKEHLDQILPGKETNSVYIDMVNEKLILTVDFLVNVNERQKIRSNIVTIVFDFFKDYVAV